MPFPVQESGGDEVLLSTAVRGSSFMIELISSHVESNCTDTTS
jgi:hypothetical protein